VKSYAGVLQQSSACVLRQRPAPGITLVELVVVTVVLIGVLALAMPSMRGFAQGNRLRVVRSALVESMALARASAVSQGLPVVVQALGAGSTGNELGEGWELVLDEDADGVASDTERRLHRFNSQVADGIQVAGNRSLRFLPTGALGGAVTARYSICRSEPDLPGWVLIVTPVGVAETVSVARCGAAP